MPHESEKTYTERVGDHLKELFGEDKVEQDYTFEDTGREADFWVDLGFVILAVEVENDWEACIEGVGQALLYAHHDHRAVPILVTPPDHVETPEVYMLKEAVTIVELDV